MRYRELVDLVLASNNIVFFGGAGVSTESGIPDFRSATGLYNRKNNTGFSPEYMLSHEFLMSDHDGFSRYYKENLIVNEVEPNVTHRVLARLEKLGKLKALITQNIDSLHQKAGSKKVYELHGNLRDFYCISCGKKYRIKDINKDPVADYCECGGYIRPDVVLYGEPLPEKTIIRAVEKIKDADVLIIGGTSLTVYPAAGFINYYKGKKCVLINKDDTGKNYIANYLVRDELGNFFREVEKVLDELDYKYE